MAAIQGRKGGSSETKTPVEAPDSIRSVARAKMLLALGEGEFAGGLDGTRIFADGTPLIGADGTENFPGFKWEFRPGTQHQEHIPGLPSVENEIGVGVELRSTTPWVRAVSNAQLSAVRLRLSWPALQQQVDGGDVTGYRIDYVVEVSTAGNGWVQALAATINDKTTTKYERSHRIELPASAGGWSVRVRRLTANQDSNKIADTMRIEAITEVIDAKLRYPNTALLYVEYDASQFQNQPKISCKPRMRVIRVPTNYNPESRNYSGIWDGTFKWAWTNNPAWVLYDIILSKRFGMGRRLDASMVDRWELYQIAQYCDELVSDGHGGMEPRFTCNIYIQDAADAWDVLRDIAAIFRGITYWSGREMVAQADMPSDVEYVFSRSNTKVVDGKISYSSQSERSRYSSVLVAYDNPKNRYESEPEPVSIPSLVRRYGFNQTQITAIGCVSQSEASRRGRWLLLTNAIDRSITFTTGLDGYLPKPGRIIGMADAFLAGRELAGRISLVSGRQITLDRDVVVKAGDRLLVNLPSGRAEARTVEGAANRVVTVTTAYSETPQAQAQWGIESTDLVIQQYRVTSVTRNDKGFEVSGIMTDPGKYSQVDSGTRLETRPISVIPARAQDAPTAVKLSSYTRVVQGIAVTTLRADWEAAKGAIAYTAEWRKDSGEWITVPRTSSLGFEVPGIYAGRYVVRVRAVNVMDVASLFAYSEETLLKGKEGLPPAVTSLTATSLLFGIGLQWGFPAGAEDTQRTEIWYGPANNLGAATKLADLAYPQSDYSMQSLQAGASFFFWARLVDRTGNIGPFYPVANGVQGQASSEAGPILDVLAGQITESELGQHLLGEIDKISGDGPESVNGRIEAAKEELEGRIDDITDALEYDPTKNYLKDDNARSGQRLYTAIQAVPANAGGGNAPPNSTYWLDIGGIVSTVNAQASQIQKNTTDITTVDGKVTAQADSLQSLQASYRDDDGEGDLAGALNEWDSAAKFADEVRTSATEREATAIHLTTLDAQVAGNKAGISTLETVVATDRAATASRLDQLKAEVIGNTADIQEVQTAQVTTDATVASLRTTVEAVYTAGRDDDAEGDLAGALEAWGSTAKFAEETRVRADGDTAQARRSEQLEVSIGSTNAAVQTVSQAVVALDGKASTMWSVKMQLNSQGQYVAAGIGLGIENGPAGLQSKFLVSADLFAVVNGINGTLSSPFAVTGGQVFMNSAFIQDGTITNAKIGSYISSTNYIPGQQGWILNKDGTLEINGIVPGQGRLVINSLNVSVYDANNVLRVRLGYLG